MRLSRGQLATLIALCLGYTGYYLCRSNLSVATPLLLEDRSLGLDKTTLVWIASVAIWANAAAAAIYWRRQERRLAV